MLNKIIECNHWSQLLLFRNKILKIKLLIMAAQLLRQLHLVSLFLKITLNTVVAMGTVSKTVPGWGVILRIVGYGMIHSRNILPLEGRRRLAET